MTNIPDINDICKCCGYDFGSHSVDGLRCPKNGGHLIDGRLEYFASHFEPEISETDQLCTRIATLEAENARLTAAHAMQGEELVTLPRHMVYSMEDKLKAQAEEIRTLKEHLGAIEIITALGDYEMSYKTFKAIRAHTLLVGDQ